VSLGQLVDALLHVPDGLADLVGVFAAGLVVDEADQLAQRVLDLVLVLGDLLASAVTQLAGHLPALLDDVVRVHLEQRNHPDATSKGS
jgi:hypothetical protein